MELPGTSDRWPNHNEGLDHRLVHLAGESKASRRKTLICRPRSQRSLRLHWVLDQTMIKAHNEHYALTTDL